MSVREFTVRVDAELVEYACRSSKVVEPSRFIAGAVATAILDAFDGGSIHVECDDVGITATMEPSA